MIRSASLVILLILALFVGPTLGQSFQSTDSFEDTHPGDVLHLQLYGPGAETSDEAPNTEFGVGFGYSNFSIGSSAIDGEGMLRIEPWVAFAPFPRVSQLRLGFACGVGLDFSDSQGVIISGGNGLIIAGSTTIPFWVLEPEFRLSWRQYLTPERSWFVEPGAAVGMVYAKLDFSADNGDHFNESDTALTGRVFLNIGMRAGQGSGGLSMSYMRGESINLADNVQGEAEEFYVGFFGSIRY